MKYNQALFLGTYLALTALTAQAGNSISGNIPRSIDFRNGSNEPIEVVMDTDRERHVIAPHGQATFSESNIGDIPTFRIYRPGSKTCLFSRKTNLAINASYGWNGENF